MLLHRRPRTLFPYTTGLTKHMTFISESLTWAQVRSALDHAGVKNMPGSVMLVNW